MRRFFLVLLMLCVAFVSCADRTVIENESSQSQNSETLSGEESSEVFVGNKYVANTNSLKYHTQFCSYIQGMSEESAVITSDIQMLIERGYEPCKFCIARNTFN